MKLFNVEIVLSTVVAAESELEANRYAEANYQDWDDNPVESVSSTEITSLAELPSKLVKKCVALVKWPIRRNNR